MTLSKGWINRQITRVEQESKTWPDWMRREAEIRAQEQKVSADDSSDTSEPKAAIQTKKAEGA